MTDVDSSHRLNYSCDIGYTQIGPWSPFGQSNRDLLTSYLVDFIWVFVLLDNSTLFLICVEKFPEK